MKTLTIEEARDWVANGWSSDVNLDEVTELAPEAAAVLAGKDGDISLSNLTEIDTATAKALSAHANGDLNLYGLRHIEEGAAAELANHPGGLGIERVLVGGLGRQALEARPDFDERWIANVMGEEEAREFIEDSDAISPTEFHAITTDAAEIIARYEGDELSLWNLMDLSAEAAGKLAAFSGKIIIGPYLKELPSEIVAIFRNRDGGLRLPLEKLDASMAAVLPKKGPLVLDYLRTLAYADIEPLMAREGDVDLENISEIDEAAASILATVRGDLNLSSVRKITPLTLKELAPHAHELALGIEWLDANQARELCRHQGPLRLRSLRFILPDVASMLADFPHRLMLDEALIPDEGLEILRKRDDFSDDWASNQVLDAETAVGDDLYQFGKMPLLGAGAVDVLISKQEHEEYKSLSLDQILAISDEDAKKLASFRGSIELGVHELSDKAAEALSSHRGSLRLGSLAVITREGAISLARHKELTVSDTYLSAEILDLISGRNTVEANKDEDGGVSPASEEATSSLHFNLGRIRARFEGGSANRMGGFGPLLDDIAENISDGANIGFLKYERLLVEFMDAAKQGEDTSMIRKAIDDAYWES
jgi:hypothetical protein